jgi:hypothetical protein
MGKYTPLRTYLESRSAETVPMTFSEIERLIGFKLPQSQAYAAWWSNNPTNNVMTKEWLAAGYKTEQVDLEGRKLVFRRTRPPSGSVQSAAREPANSSPRRHPLLGWLKGTVTIAPGTDLTKPADPEWGESAWGELGPAVEMGHER